MINKLGIKNFESHEETELEFCDTVNVIIGKNDQGKSSIERALYWLVFNRPLGDMFCRDTRKKGESTEISVRLKEGVTLTRKRKGSFNGYILNDKKKLEGFGSEVPSQVSEVLNMGDVNFQGQHDLPFLMFSGVGEVTQYLNSVVKIDTIDSSQKMVNKWIKEINNKNKFLEEKINEKTLQLKKFEDIEEFENRLNKLEDLEKSITVEKEKVSTLIEYNSNLKKLKEKYNYWNELARFEADLLRLLGMEKIFSEQKRRLLRISKLRDDLSRLTLSIGELSRVTKLEPRIDKLLEVAKRVKDTFSNIQLKKEKSGYLEDLKMKIKNCDKDLRDLEKKYKESMPEICPICEKPMN